MMLSHPVLLGLWWSLLVYTASGQDQISNKETNKVYAYTYHFQHNGTTNSKELLKSVLGGEIDTPDDRNIVKTFSSPNIRGFFTKGVLPAGPQSSNYIRSSFNRPSAIDGIKKIVEQNLQPPPPPPAVPGLLPVSLDINKEFPGDFNNFNQLGGIFQNQDDFPKIPPPPAPPVNNEHVIRKVQNFVRNTPDGGRVVGKIESYSYNPPPVVNSVSHYQQNVQSHQENENYVNNNLGHTGHRTQSYFRQNFKTLQPNIQPNTFSQDNRIDVNPPVIRNNNINNQNQWWNVLGNVNNANRPSFNNANRPSFDQPISRNIQQIQNQVENQLKNSFGRRLNTFTNNINANNAQFNNQANRAYNAHQQQHNRNFNNHLRNNAFNHRHTNNQQTNYQNFADDKTVKDVVNLINEVQNQLSNLKVGTNAWNNLNPTNRYFRAQNNVVGNTALKLEDNAITNNDWSSRGNGRPFSNAHSGPLNIQTDIKPADIIKTNIQALVGNREIKIPSISDVGNGGNSYRNVNGGGNENFFGVDKVVEGPNSFSRNQHSGYERNFQVNSNSGYQRSNQWSTNTVRRLDPHGAKADFNRDFIDVFRDDY